jgi:fucose 4-O-acetylase-like acetyltransferase
MTVAPVPNKTRNIPSLDGLRGVSILLVMLGHAHGTRGFPSGIPSFVTDHASPGVQIFFVISEPSFAAKSCDLDSHFTWYKRSVRSQPLPRRIIRRLLRRAETKL